MSFMCRALALRVVACGVIGETARVGEWTSTLRALDAHALDALYAVMSEQGRGRTVFVAGDDRAGRSALLHDWLDGLAAMPVAPRVLGGVFEDGEYVPWERDRVVASDAVRALERLLSAGESAVSLLELGLPAAVTTLLGQVLAKSKEALELTHRALAAPSETSGAMLVPRALRRLCEDGPVVCVIETADLHAGGLWADLVERFARRVATNVALLLVLSLDGPAELGAHTDDARRPERRTTADEHRHRRGDLALAPAVDRAGAWALDGRVRARSAQLAAADHRWSRWFQRGAVA
jgi:hypothetical protein